MNHKKSKIEYIKINIENITHHAFVMILFLINVILLH